ncbi:unnamed protein product [Rodentolepis nana]|uniref:RING-type domain-containing protein n=1 Tax=Rodentolepis nana TaxID=102285 RepID=A0A158QJ52_RODNA|nr:unnamed protein product [Rodentolepis nana]
MVIFTFEGNQHKSRNDSIVSNNSGSVRHKWRLKRSKPINSEPASENLSNDSLPGMVRVPATDLCVVCANDVEYVYILSKCGHRACIDCWRRFAYSQVSSFAMAHITCIACDRRLSRALTIQLLKPRPLENGAFDGFSNSDLRQAEKIYHRYEDFLLRQCLSRDKRTRWCPRGCGTHGPSKVDLEVAPGSTERTIAALKLDRGSLLYPRRYALLAGSGFRSCPRIKCEHPDCEHAEFCYKCHSPWNPNHVCKGSGHGSTAATEGGSSSNAGTAGNFFAGDNPRSLLSQLRQLFRFPSAPVVTTDTAGGATTNSRRRRRPTEDVEGGTWSELTATTASTRKFSTTAMPLQVDDNTELGTNTDDEIEANVFANKE